MKIINWFFVILAIAGLISVRILEDKIFYDPFLDYFQDANTSQVFPKFIWAKLVLNYVFRFTANSFFSLLIVHFLFQNKNWTVQALVLLVMVFVITFPVYLFCIDNRFEIGYLFSFYMRRFVIQPIVLLLIIPLFYFRKYQQ